VYGGEILFGAVLAAENFTNTELSGPRDGPAASCWTAKGGKLVAASNTEIPAALESAGASRMTCAAPSPLDRLVYIAFSRARTRSRRPLGRTN